MNSSQVMIVSQAFAQNYFPGENALGKKLKPNAANGTPGGSALAGDRRRCGQCFYIQLRSARRFRRYIFRRVNSRIGAACISVVRTSLDPMSLEPAVRHLVSSMDGDIPGHTGADNAGLALSAALSARLANGPVRRILPDWRSF